MANNNFSRILLRKGTAEELRNVNPFLKKGEPITEYDTGKMKLGDGIHRWNDLKYANDNTETILVIKNIQYYGDKDITPSDESYFIVNETGETITGLTGDVPAELVIPYEINGIEITTLENNSNKSILDGFTSSISKIVLPNTISKIGNYAFNNCSSLTSINIPDSVTNIGTAAFQGTSSLTSINIPDSVTNIRMNAFNGCTSLTSITIPNSVTSIEGYAFQYCTSLKSIEIPNSVTNIGEYAFHIYNNESDSFIPLSGLTVYCEQGSYAETYAKTNNIPVIYTDISATNFNNKADKSTTLSGYGITDAYTKGEIDNKISNVYEIKGSSTIANLPTNPEVGDVYNITDSGTITGTEIEVSVGDNIVYTSDGWDKLSATVDLSGYQEKLTFDSTPTADSTNPVTSGGAKTALNGKLDKTDAVGQKTASGGEIFNNYTNNEASGKYSHAEGSFTNASIVTSHAEGYLTSTAIKGFKVLEIDTTNNKVRLSEDDISKLSLYSKIGVIDRNNTYYSGSITKIDGAWVTISSSISVNKFIINPTSTNIQGYLIPYVVNNGEPIGSIELNTGALSVSSHTEGSGTHAFLDAHAEGKNVFAPGKASHSEGLGTQSVGDHSHAEGHYSISKGNGSHSEGDNSLASGNYSHAENYNTHANAESSHTEGIKCITTVNAKGGHAEGANTKVNAYAAHAEGNNTIASSEAQHVEGSFNIEDTENKYIHIAGNGYVDSNNNEIRQNAHTIDRGGNAWFSGWVKIGGASFDDENAQYVITDQILQGILSEMENKLDQKADKTFINAALERIKYYNSADIMPSDASYFTVNETGETIVGLTDTGKAQTGTLVIPYEINGVEITTLGPGSDYQSMLDGASDKFTKIILPNTITTINNYAFISCTSLTSINIPDSVTVIGDYAFYDCSALTSIEIQDGFTSIGNNAFQGCTSLKSISIPNSVTGIGYDAFLGCTSLTSIEIPDGVTSIGAFTGCTSLKSVEIPDGVTRIEDQAFDGCTSLKSIELPNSITHIGDIAFQDCTSLTSVEIPNSVTSIGNNAFHIYNTETHSYTPISGLTIYCEQGSYAETYATNIGFNIVYTDVSDITVTKVVEINIPTEGWTTGIDINNNAYYTIKIENEKLTSNGYPICDLVASDDIPTARLEKDAYQYIDKITINDGNADFYCFNRIPTATFKIRIQIMYI